MRTASALVGLFVLVSQPATAGQSPASFLSSLSGSFKGKGEALVSVTREKVRIQCKLDNRFDKSAGQLSIKGRCATTQGKRKIDGTLQVVNTTIRGTFLSPSSDSEITKTRSAYENGRLVTYISFVNKTSGELTRIRQILSSNGDGSFVSRFQRFDNASDKYRDTGIVNFTPIVAAGTN